MQDDTITEAETLCAAALDSLRSHGLPATPRNYAVWYEFHGGRNAKLRRVLSVALTNRRSVDAYMMAELHEHFIAVTPERQAAREARSTLREAAGRIIEAGADAVRYGSTLTEVATGIGTGGDSGVHGIASMIARLAAEAADLSERSARLGAELNASGEKIAALEKQLAAAHQASLTDPLTSLPNRRAFDSLVLEHAGQAMNSGEDLSLLMIDIDHFKRVNDHWGHTVGDAVIRLVASIIAQHGPETARPARYGGEEFAVLLPATPLRDAAAHGESLRGTLAGRRVSLRANAETIGAVTVSIGAARYEPGEAVGRWIERADAALYRAKEEGRNRVVVAEPALAGMR
jgi:diguanylate cyclase